MNFLLKIVEGPNKGAEIALPEGVAVTLGKSDDCDIVLADNTLPDEPVSIEANGTGVSAGGEPAEPFHIKTIGSTSFAVGPADGPWGELKWPEREKVSRGESSGEESSREDTENRSEEGGTSRRAEEPQSEGDENLRNSASPREKEKRRGCLGCLLWVVLLFVVLGVLCWIFREQTEPYVDKAKPYANSAWTKIEKLGGTAARWCGSEESTQPSNRLTTQPPDHKTISALAARYGLELTNHAGRVALAGDFATRAERLSVTAEAYAAYPGIELDFCDDESLRTAAEDTLALVGEKSLRVAAATNRIVALSGKAFNLRRTLEALAADMPKLRNVDASAVSLAVMNTEIGQGTLDERRVAGASRISSLESKKTTSALSLPVCGILTTPYPCLVLKNGARVMEGAPLGNGIILKIEADSVTLTNSTGRFTWKP